MPGISSEIRKINERQLRDCTFARSLGFSTDCDARERHRRVHLSMLLADNVHYNVKLVFNTMEGYREILTSIWGTTEKLILLKSGNHIPVDSVVYASLE